MGAAETDGRILRGGAECAALAVARKLLTRSRRAPRRRRLELALLASADLAGLPLSSLPRWRVWGAPGEGPRAQRAREAQEALDGLRRLLRELCRLYRVPLEEEGPERAVTALRLSSGLRMSSLRGWTAPPGRARAAAPERADLEYLLWLVFGKPAFRPGQAEAVSRLLRGEDVFAVLPAGGGKSLVYQLAGLLRPGAALVLEPTLALIEDQLRTLAGAGIDSAEALTGESSGSPEGARALARLLRGDCSFFFVSPERLQTPGFRRVLARVAAGPGLALAAVDEAHCVSEWGHDFRVPYLRIAAALGERPPLAALSATAPAPVRADVLRRLAMAPGSVVEAAGPGAALPRVRILRCREDEKPARLRAILGGGGGGIVFCPHALGAHGAAGVAGALRAEGFAPLLYHGRPPAGVEVPAWRAELRAASAAFGSGEEALLVATKAFGLGVDRPGVRRTVHYGLPSSPEAFRQEAARAGRDGRVPEAWVLFRVDGERRARRWLDPAFPHARLRAEVEAADPARDDDVLRLLRLHLGGFRGADRELDDVRELLERLGEPFRAGPRRLRLPGQHRPLVERALQRLLEGGAAVDWLVDYRREEYRVVLGGAAPAELEAALAREAQLLGTTPPPAGGWPAEPRARAQEAARRAAGLVYAVVEPARRAALGAAVRACLEEDAGALLGAQIPAAAREKKSVGSEEEPRSGGSAGGFTFQPRSWSIWKKALKNAAMRGWSMKPTFSKLLFSAFEV
jgi:RecQ family ATP-dependent DNA helicase